MKSKISEEELKKYGIDVFEKWIGDRVEEGVFPSREEAYRVLGYYAWSLYKWINHVCGYTIILKEGITPLTLEKIFELGGDIADIEKMKEKAKEFYEKYGVGEFLAWISMESREARAEYLESIKKVNSGDYKDAPVARSSGELVGSSDGLVENTIIPNGVLISEDSFTIIGKNTDGRNATIVVNFGEEIKIWDKVIFPKEIKIDVSGFTIYGPGFSEPIHVNWGETIKIKCKNPMVVSVYVREVSE